MRSDSIPFDIPVRLEPFPEHSQGADEASTSAFEEDSVAAATVSLVELIGDAHEQVQGTEVNLSTSPAEPGSMPPGFWPSPGNHSGDFDLDRT